jgi:hypothetical protein
MQDETKIIERNEDMSPRGRLRLLLQPDGDIVVAVVPDPDERRQPFGPTVEFCSPAGGGGRSRHTLRALRELAAAMELDNQERPIGGRPTTPSEPTKGC